jgi:hypothetical protein
MERPCSRGALARQRDDRGIIALVFNLESRWNRDQSI